MLETNVNLYHPRCCAEEDAHFYGHVFLGHASVTELDICRETWEYDEAAQAQAWAHAVAGEQAAEAAWDNQGYALDDATLTAGGVPAYYDPQAV